MVEHVQRVREKIEPRIKGWLSAELPLDYYLIEHKSKPTKKYPNGRMGYGWASPRVRWCTALKREMLKKMLVLVLAQRGNPKSVPYSMCVGIAADEIKRLRDIEHYRYPLAEWGVTENDALKYCYSIGYDFGGLYSHFSRVSCFCCPLQGIKDYWALRKFYPEQWAALIDKDMRQTSTETYQLKRSLKEIAKKLDEYERGKEADECMILLGDSL